MTQRIQEQLDPPDDGAWKGSLEQVLILALRLRTCPERGNGILRLVRPKHVRDPLAEFKKFARCTDVRVGARFELFESETASPKRVPRRAVAQKLLDTLRVTKRYGRSAGHRTKPPRFRQGSRMTRFWCPRDRHRSAAPERPRVENAVQTHCFLSAIRRADAGMPTPRAPTEDGIVMTGDFPAVGAIPGLLSRGRCETDAVRLIGSDTAVEVVTVARAAVARVTGIRRAHWDIVLLPTGDCEHGPDMSTQSPVFCSAVEDRRVHRPAVQTSTVWPGERC